MNKLTESHPHVEEENSIPTNCVKKFVFRSHRNRNLEDDNENEFDTLEVIVPEMLTGSYGLYVWPSASILAWYLFEHRQFLRGKRVLELGAGTALPGVLSALCGADVILSDSIKLPQFAAKTVEANALTDKVKVIGITWGLFLQDLIKLRGQVDIILGSDCFFDPVVFEDLIATVAFLLADNHSAKALFTYQERSSDWSIESLLKKWNLHCNHVPLSDLANTCEVEIVQLMQDHTIHLIEITIQEETEGAESS